MTSDEMDIIGTNDGAGLGGDRDTTNVFESSNLAASVITTIGEERMAALGGSLETIAEAKAGITKHGRPVGLGGPFLAHIKDIIYSKAASLSSPVVLASSIGSGRLVHQSKASPTKMGLGFVSLVTLLYKVKKMINQEVWKLILLRLDPVCNLFSSWLQLLSWLRQGSAAAPKTMRTVVAQAAIFSSMASTQQTQQRSSQPRVNKGHKFV
ncbi:hypothetical protein HID58_011793 [Brassica napus]|uniref:Uncharacterized protein n=1 Tax=Brassica napus TaxID=3708 RepID=A0ABQ8DZA7_BRANA|nr:hypothetical protein HID58_011793 [Brassica napus]